IHAAAVPDGVRTWEGPEGRWYAVWVRGDDGSIHAFSGEAGGPVVWGVDLTACGEWQQVHAPPAQDGDRWCSNCREAIEEGVLPW
ncbi:MAG: hypothetical protein ACREN5_05755, partial [Gemmatimonadales bacterium]